MICLSVIIPLWRGSAGEVKYWTPLGQSQTFVLSDGSRAILDAATEIDVRYSRAAREIRLLKGQARFQVTHNATRPFSVEAGGEAVVAVGTDFNVDLVGPEVAVTLIKGRVTVGPAGPKRAPPVILYPGQQLVASPTQPVYVHSASIAGATAWEAGLLVFDNQSLGSVVSIVSRYSALSVTSDREVSALRISGVFKEGDVSSFVDVVTHYLPVTASEAAGGRITLHRKP
jgi:transmembrane sensor